MTMKETKKYIDFRIDYIVDGNTKTCYIKGRNENNAIRNALINKIKDEEIKLLKIQRV